MAVDALLADSPTAVPVLSLRAAVVASAVIWFPAERLSAAATLVAASGSAAVSAVVVAWTAVVAEILSGRGEGEATGADAVLVDDGRKEEVSTLVAEINVAVIVVAVLVVVVVAANDLMLAAEMAELDVTAG